MKQRERWRWKNMFRLLLLWKGRLRMEIATSYLEYWNVQWSEVVQRVHRDRSSSGKARYKYKILHRKLRSQLLDFDFYFENQSTVFSQLHFSLPLFIKHSLYFIFSPLSMPLPLSLSVSLSSPPYPLIYPSIFRFILFFIVSLNQSL